MASDLGDIFKNHVAEVMIAPPNPRLQRTRSALLRSPLSRKPLGALKVS